MATETRVTLMSSSGRGDSTRANADPLAGGICVSHPSSTPCVNVVPQVSFSKFTAHHRAISHVSLRLMSRGLGASGCSRSLVTSPLSAFAHPLSRVSVCLAARARPCGIRCKVLAHTVILWEDALIHSYRVRYSHYAGPTKRTSSAVIHKTTTTVGP